MRVAEAHRGPSGERSPLRSGLYEGRLVHRRFGPGPEHEFAYDLAMPLLFLDELDQVAANSALFRNEGRAPVAFWRRDFFGDPHQRLDEAVRDLVGEQTGERPSGRVALLANVRTWGWLFNPIACYYCFDEAGEHVVAFVAEVENTPWHERHPYVVGPAGRHRFEKALHVSPFLPMDLDYELTYTEPGARLSVAFELERFGEPTFHAALALSRRELDAAALRRLLWNYSAMTLRVSAGIYRQAIALAAKRAPFFTNPRTLARRTGRRP